VSGRDPDRPEERDDDAAEPKAEVTVTIRPWTPERARAMKKLLDELDMSGAAVEESVGDRAAATPNQERADSRPVSLADRVADLERRVAELAERVDRLDRLVLEADAPLDHKALVARGYSEKEAYGLLRRYGVHAPGGRRRRVARDVLAVVERGELP
jgi:hypothetical protein